MLTRQSQVPFEQLFHKSQGFLFYCIYLIVQSLLTELKPYEKLLLHTMHLHFKGFMHLQP